MTANAGFLLLARVVSAATTVLVLAIVGRTLGADALGVVGVGFAIGAIAAVLSDLGSTSLFVREAARRADRAGSLLLAALAIRIVTVPIVIAGAWLVATVAFPASVPTIVLVAGGLVAQQAAEATRFVFLARQRMSVSAAHVIVENVGWAVAIGAILATGGGLPAAFSAGALVLTASIGVGLALAWRLAGVRPRRLSRAAIGELIGQARPFVAFNVLGIAYSRIDTLLVGLLAPVGALAAAGAYFASARLVAAFEYLPDAVSRAIFPELSKRAVDAPATAAPLLGRAARSLLVVAVPVPGLLLVVAPWLMPTLFGADIEGQAWVAAALAVVVPIRSIGYLYGMALTSTDRQGRRALAAACGLATVVILDVVLIPPFGIAGAVVGATVASLVVVGLYGREVSLRIGSVGLDPTTIGLAIGAAVVATGVGLLALGPIGPVPAALLTGAAYALLVAVSPLRSALSVGRLRRRVAG